MADLTRFDFHVVRFLSSEAVKEMTAEEIGQYVLLLCDAWLLAKDATLPDNPAYLARTARCERVSDLVMTKFPIVETQFGTRRRNIVLYGEWMMAAERSASAAERGRVGNETRWGDRNGDGCSDSNGDRYRDRTATSLISPIPYQFKPNQPNHINQNTNIEFPSGSFGQGSYSNIRTHWYRYFKKNLSTSKRNKEQYAQACAAYNEDCVLEYLETWAAANDWVSAHPRGDNRLYVFLAALSAMVAGDQMRQDSETKVVATKKSDEDVWAATRTADDAERKKENEEWESKQKEEQILIELGKGGL